MNEITIALINCMIYRWGLIVVHTISSVCKSSNLYFCYQKRKWVLSTLRTNFSIKKQCLVRENLLTPFALFIRLNSILKDYW